MKPLTFSLLLLAVATYTNAQDPNETTLKTFSRFYENNQPDSLYTLFDDGMKKAIPSSTWPDAFHALHQQMGRLGPFILNVSTDLFINYTATTANPSTLLMLSLNKDHHIQGLFNIPAPSNEPPTPINYHIRTNGGSLAGTLTLPTDSTHPMPVALIIAGSGPVDHDGNPPYSTQDNSYRYLAEQLKAQGIATLRYDKRYIGESKDFTQPKDSIVIEDFIDDAKACIQNLKADRRFSSVTIIGHSEGALIGMLTQTTAKQTQTTAQQTAPTTKQTAPTTKADKYISLAGAGENAAEIMKKQLSNFITPAINQLLDSLAAGYRVHPPSLYAYPWAAYFTAKIQKYLISWFKYDPTKEIARLRIPTLIIQGSIDLQVPEDNAKKLGSAQPAATLLVIPSMGHSLRNGSDHSVNPEMVNAITQFITHK